MQLTLETIHLFVDEIKAMGMTQTRVSAVRNGQLIHTVIRWSDSSARQDMRRWLTKNVPLFDSYSVAN